MLGRRIFDCYDATNGIGICMSLRWLGLPCVVRSLIAMVQWGGWVRYVCVT